MIERAHIANKPRREDRRLVVMLCTICHKSSHGERVANFSRPKLSANQLLEIKRSVDPEWYDAEFVGKHSIRLMECEPIDPWYEEEKVRRRGG
jgi:hypothetical protein